jgi:hypothetical protein
MALAQKLTRSGAFYVVRDGDPLVARRVRKLPLRRLICSNLLLDLYLTHRAINKI